MKILSYLFVIAFLAMTFSACDDDSSGDEKIVTGGEIPDNYTGPVTRILEDNVHATKQNSTYELVEADFNYSHMYAYNRIFKHLNANGYSHDRLVSGKLTADLLSRYDILFINLMDNDKPNYSEEEIENVRAWVEAGGGLFLIADHTNVYRHAEMSNPLLAPYGIEIRYEIAVDVSPHTVSGLGWILVQDLRQHPVNEGIIEYSLQTGGPVDGPGGTGYTSSGGWGDYWDESHTGGFYGNWIKDEGEQSGPQPVVQAVSYGQGGVFVAGDQNMFGDPFIWFLDNDGLAFNAFEWLAHRSDEAIPLRNRPAAGLNIRVDTAADSLSQGKAGVDYHYTFYVNLNRVREVTAHATRTPLPFTPDVYMVLEPRISVDASSFEEMDEVLESGGQVVYVMSAENMTDTRRNLLSELTDRYSFDPGFVDGSGNPVDLTDEPTINTINHITADREFRGEAPVLPVCAELKCPGHAILTAADENGNSCDLMCSYDTDNGRIILSLTGMFFREWCLKDEHDVPDYNFTEGLYSQGCYVLELGLTDILLEY
ncbi:hypothetical protein KKF97_15195 [Myxococcota bacterium]|nr:hypothetical protein [Myxococcota bacterium]MBU1382782.1 hypothetical protein [Myxococcota bacterium]MBU1502661.1 hypothetical protein [bacterium]